MPLLLARYKVAGSRNKSNKGRIIGMLNTSLPGRSAEKVVVPYSKLVVPVSMRSIYWKFFGFPANDAGEIISRQRIICVLCKTQIAYNKNTTNLRMHLQSKHLQDLVEVESSVSMPRTPKASTKKFLEPFEYETVDDGLQTGIKHETFYVENAEGEVVAIEPDIAIGDAQNKKDFVLRNTAVEGGVSNSSMVNMVAQFTIHDLAHPDVVEGRGFQRFLVNIISPCSLPSQQMLTNEIIPKLFEVERKKLLKELSTHTGDMGLTIEEWVCGRGRCHLSICVYYLSAENGVECKMLRTISFIPSMDCSQWELVLASVLGEWNITADRVTAVVCSTEREAILNAFCNHGYILIPCFDYTIQECVRQCFHNDVIKEIIDKIRDQIIVLKDHPLTCGAISDLTKSMECKLSLDVEAVWLSTLEMLEKAVQWRKVITKQISLTGIGEPLRESLALADDEWQIIVDLITALQPFKMSLLSLGEENIPFISLLRPMLWQVINKKLSPMDGDSETLQNLKKATVDLLNYRYQDERLTPLLNVATVVDPRFKILSYLPSEEKTMITNDVIELLQKIELEDRDEEKECSFVEGSKKSNMEMLLGVSKDKKPKLESVDPSVSEFERYLNFPNASLDICPVKWWEKQRDSYQRLRLLADKYLCVPAVATFPRKRTLESMLSFHTKRSTLPDELLQEYLFLHVNYILP